MRMQQAGRGNGEPHEIANAAFAPLGKTTMYMSRMNRQVRPVNIVESVLSMCRAFVQDSASQMICSRTA